ncbi:hypothetical protein HDE_11132 [Halotydeus destructor]|nr:hypothetical protein HDE_11132 [Halotydeus destructor]
MKFIVVLVAILSPITYVATVHNTSYSGSPVNGSYINLTEPVAQVVPICKSKMDAVLVSSGIETNLNRSLEFAECLSEKFHLATSRVVFAHYLSGSYRIIVGNEDYDVVNKTNFTQICGTARNLSEAMVQFNRAEAANGVISGFVLADQWDNATAHGLLRNITDFAVNLSHNSTLININGHKIETDDIEELYDSLFDYMLELMGIVCELQEPRQHEVNPVANSSFEDGLIKTANLTSTVSLDNNMTVASDTESAEDSVIAIDFATNRSESQASVTAQNPPRESEPAEDSMISTGFKTNWTESQANVTAQTHQSGTELADNSLITTGFATNRSESQANVTAQDPPRESKPADDSMISTGFKTNRSESQAPVTAQNPPSVTESADNSVITKGFATNRSESQADVTAQNPPRESEPADDSMISTGFTTDWSEAEAHVTAQTPPRDEPVNLLPTSSGFQMTIGFTCLLVTSLSVLQILRRDY